MTETWWMALGPVDQDPDQARDDACDLLSPSTVCDPPDPQFETPSSPSGAGGGFGAVGWVLLVVAIAVLVGLLVRVIAARVRVRDQDESGEDDEDTDEIVPLERVEIDLDNTPGDWRSRSQRHRAAGELRDALRCEYRALVGDLARRHLLDEIPGRTTGEERTQLRRTASVVNAPFGAATDVFDKVWYGGDDATAELLDRFDALAAEVLAATAATRVPAAQR